MEKRALIIDHNDSFVWNISAWLHPYFNSDIVNHKEISNIDAHLYDLVILSPGPKAPADYPQTVQFLKSFPDQKPLLGICLGLQIMTITYHGVVTELSHPVHGKSSLLYSDKYKEWNNTQVARYHSLHCLPSDQLIIDATTQDNVVMWVHHKTKKQIGIQFHPESFLTSKSAEMASMVHQWAVHE